MAHRCKVAKGSRKRCYVHSLPISSVRYLFNDIIVGDYSKQQLKDYHNHVMSLMLEKTKSIPMDDA